MRIIIVALALGSTVALAAESYEALFESAVRAVTWDLDDQWAFTETKAGTDGTLNSQATDPDPHLAILADWLEPFSPEWAPAV